jgi:dolichol-phosphate mannosyltransferase
VLESIQRYAAHHAQLAKVLYSSPWRFRVLRILQAYYLGRGLGIESRSPPARSSVDPARHVAARHGQRARLDRLFVWFFAREACPRTGPAAVGAVHGLGSSAICRAGFCTRQARRRGGANLLPSLSIIIPAYNESENIIDTLENVTKALEPLPVRHEILVIDDGSADTTAALVTSNLNRFPAVRLLVNERNMGFGWSYRRGVDAASLDHIVMVHGDNAWGHETLREFFSRVGQADVIVGYTRNMWGTRTKTRTLISKAYTLAVNLITRRRLKYYNGLQIHTAPVLKSIKIQSSGYGFQSEVLVKSLRRTRTVIEVPMDLIEREKGESKAFRLKNFVDVFRTLKVLCAVELGRDA